MTDLNRPVASGVGGPVPSGSTVVVASGRSFESSPYVEWQSILAGAVTALAVAFVLLTFGSAVGLSAVSPWTSTRTTVTVVSIGAGFWMMLVHVWAFGLGGYLAARMRHRHAGAAQTEVEFRDGAHGVAVWGVAVTFGAVVAALVAASASRGGPNVSSYAARATDPVTIAADTLLRTPKVLPAGAAEESRAEVARVLARSMALPAMPVNDRTYLAEYVVARTGIAQTEADTRVTEAITQLKAATDRARKTGVVLAFVTSATLLLGAAAAWWGASVGGRHRDSGTIWAGFSRHGHPRSMWS